MRRAMIRMDEALAKSKLKARMLLQVHDELVFEAPKDEAEDLIKLAREVISGAAEPALSLSVPLEVDAKAADTWGQAH
jgi:DNA polymerase-1